MSIARAFTTRRVKQSVQAAEFDKAPHRSNSTKPSMGSLRHKISSPVELLHTTNMLSYNAPDIHPMSASSTGSSQRSDDDMSDSALTNGTTPPTSPDIESSPKRTLSSEPNHLSCFFTAPPQQTAAPAVQPEAPVIPQRAPSHSKKQYNTLVRQRSTSGMSQQSSHRTVSTKASFTFSRSSSSSTSTSVSSTPMYPHHHHHKSKLSAAPVAASFSPASPPRPQPPSSSQHQQQHQHQQHQQHRKDYSESQHPFGPELAQVSEIAEEYGVKEHVSSSAIDREEQEMLAKGLVKFSADDYLSEVRGLFASLMVVAPPPSLRPAPAAPTAAWI
ncbi:hypothetical protein C8A00DRAFT_11024 [Chaetomidium leptoderma]|uniref:Uncharacterized protein n=1 Tax=Chaetomidium leptoderma TaxID=669021 RepID=A0AAN6ZZW8_9PEZI|nr:hypothetical protein C8A00DRAFT_11024 [Chaetomidium leptoderma]